MAGGAPQALPTGKVTLLFTDMEGSTRLLHELGDAYGDLLLTHDRLLREVWRRHRGVEVNTEGDAFFVAFAEVEDAVAAVTEAQRMLDEHPWPSGHAAVVRMGLHVGTPKLYGRDYWGVDVNYAARLCAAANGGQVLLSDAVAAAVDADVDDLGMHALKDFPSPRRIFHLRVDDRGSDRFPPPRTLQAGRTNLPDQISTLIGRSAELADVVKLVEDQRLVTLAGPGGVGKTRLAMEAGARLLDGSADGVWLVELAGLRDETWLPNAVAAALDIRLQAGGDALPQLTAQVADRRLLLVLDNCEHLVGAAARLTEALLQRCPGVTVLTTSREPLGLAGELVYRVPSLSLPPEGSDDPAAVVAHDGVRLFVERASAHRSDFRLDDRSVADVVAVVRRLDGIPLAIELAAPWLGRLSVAELRERLEQGFALLQGGRRTALDRQRTIGALIDWSYDRLPPAEQRLLGELSAFAGGFDLRAAESVCEPASGSDLLITLGALVDKSMVQVEDLSGDVRYRLLEAVRAYAAEKLHAEDGEAERVAARHLRHYLQLAEELEAERDRANVPRRLAALRRDRDNLRAAVARALRDPDPEVGLRLTAAVTRFWIEDGHAPEALAGLDAALASSAGVTAARANALVWRAGLFPYEIGSDVSAMRLSDAEEALDIARRLGDNLLAVRALHWQVWLLMRLGDFSRALAVAEDAIGLVDDAVPDQIVCRLHRAKAGVEINAGIDSRASLSEALAIARRCGEVVEATRVQAQLGWVLVTRGEVAVARQELAEAVAAAHELGMEVDAVATSVNLGYAILLDGDHEEALRCEVAALEAADRQAARELRYYALLCIALARSALGQHEVAAVLHGALESELAARGDRLETFEAELQSADLERLRTTRGVGFEEHYRRGAALPFTEAVRLALRQ